MKHAKRFIASILLAGAILLFILALSQMVQQPPSQLEEAKASIPTIKEAIRSGKPFIIFFSSPGCYACQLQKPVWQEVAQDYANEVIFLHVEYNETTEQAFYDYDVRGVPTLVFVKDRLILKSHEGYMDRSSLISEVQKLLED